MEHCGRTSNESSAGSLLTKRCSYNADASGDLEIKRSQTDSMYTDLFFDMLFGRISPLISFLQFTPSDGKRDWNTQCEQKA